MDTPDHEGSHDEAPKAGRREWIGLAVIALPCLLYSMDLTVLELAVPKLSADLKPTSSQLLWILDIYGFLLAGFLVTMGTLGDRIGRRRLLLTGAAAFGAASVLAALSRSAEMLIATRALLGVAGATLAPSTLSLIRNMFRDPDQRTFAIGVWATSFSAGAAIGPLAGGVLLEFYWWGSVFLLAVPVMALLLVLGPLLLPEFRDPEAGRLDLTSAALSLVSVLAVIYGLKQIAQDGVGWLPVLSISAGLAVGAAFVRRQRELADPLIDLRLFRVPAFSASLAAFALSIFVIAGIFLFIAQYLQLVLGLSPLVAGLWTVPSSGGLIAGSMLAPLAVRRVRPAFVMAGGLALSAVGFGMLTQVDAGSGLAVIVIGSVVLALGVAPVGTLATDIIVGSAPPERAGAASGISETSAEFGGALGIAVLGSIGTAVYRSEVADGVPGGVPHDAAEAARDTLGGAVVVADELPDRLGAALLDAAREAFTQGLQLTAITGAALALGMAILVMVLLRHVRTGSEPEDRADTEQAGAVAGGAGIEKVLGRAAEVQDDCAPGTEES
jgi:MFS transporter, DHA2 family, multidrug resistance protein